MAGPSLDGTSSSCSTSSNDWSASSVFEEYSCTRLGDALVDTVDRVVVQNAVAACGYSLLADLLVNDVREKPWLLFTVKMATKERIKSAE